MEPAPEVVIVADYDDPDADNLTRDLVSRGFEVRWLQLGLSYQAYDVTIDRSRAEICGEGCLITSDVMESAKTIVVRRWKVAPPFPIVVADLPGDPESFAEREWEATFRVLFSRWRDVSNPALWSRDPFLLADKIHLLRAAELAGALVPSSQIVSRASASARDLVSKAIGPNQAVTKGHRYATTLVRRPEMDYLFEGVQPCPVLLQDKIEVEREIRVAYSFGRCGASMQQRVDGPWDPVDIRYAQVERMSVPLPEGLEEVLHSFAASTGLQLFTADVLLDGEERTWLFDINPDGLFIAADDDQRSLTSVLVNGIVANLAAG